VGAPATVIPAEAGTPATSSSTPFPPEVPAFAGMTTALYVHWPFCVSKCPYCDFNSHVRESIDQATWREALLKDLAWEAEMHPHGPLTSIFFGGGTPSLMEPATVAALIEAAERRWGFAPDVEITLEANPSSVEAARFADLAAAGTTIPCASSGAPMASRKGWLRWRRRRPASTGSAST
jgi:coproporphyrinogen III oxidase-like Fe-S oxidoreductase